MHTPIDIAQNLLSNIASPILVDVGSSLASPEIWNPIADQSTFVGFDPDDRDSGEEISSQFLQARFLPFAVTSNPEIAEIEFFLTESPYCSSTLRPDQAALTDYLFAESFAVKDQEKVPARTLGDALQAISIDRVDWLKLDTQGTDLRIYLSLEEKIRRNVLCVDIEPGLISAYHGEDFFTKCHETLIAEGFWLSDLNVKGNPRINQKTLHSVRKAHPEFEAPHHSGIRDSPGWCEARYLRRIESLPEFNDSAGKARLLVVFALLDNQTGFALDVVCTHPEHFPTELRESLIAIIMDAAPPQPSLLQKGTHFIKRRILRI